MDNNKLIVTAAPHITSTDTTQKIMQRVCLALCPTLIASVIIFGINALILVAVTVVACVFFEWGYCKLMHRENPTGDFSAVVTGMLLAFNMPATLPWWMAIVGAFIAIVVVKQLFGGLGKNFLNPALGGRAFLMLCYPILMTTWVKPGRANWAGLLSGTVGMNGAELATGATPLSVDFMHSGLLPDASLGDMLIGNVGGCLGEVSALMLIVGGIYLVVRGVIRVRVPVSFIASVAVLTFLFPAAGVGRLDWMLYNLLGGGLMLGAIFMATDYVTSPATPKGEIIFGIGCGLLTVFIRKFGGYPEGVSYAILIMNTCVWLLDKVGKPARFGVTKEMKEKQKAAKKAAKEAEAK